MVLPHLKNNVLSVGWLNFSEQVDAKNKQY